ncbi:hypothetical protein HDU86_002644 [Geranomyces michiganensis]|nr:hypothetical protein HDU86_002644 [Geranomyces michiganensis]
MLAPSPALGSSAQRSALLASLAARILDKIATSNERNTTFRIAIDGVDGAGKTHFRDELAIAINSISPATPLILASVDGFHNPRVTRYKHGRSSPVGFFENSYNYPALRRELLDPLGPHGSGLYRTAVFAVDTDEAIASLAVQAPRGAILLLDGLFLHRDELQGAFDYSIFLEVDFNVSVPRGASRGVGYGSPDVHAESNRRYIEGNRLYFERCRPRGRAQIVVDNNDLDSPFIALDRESGVTIS